METDNANIGERILFILGMSLCGVMFFILFVGVIIALFISWDEDDEKKAETNNSVSLQSRKIMRRK
ncbi:hypothetical protein [Gracilibacillus saliphilus]|uniref:hypothetical protein n=1 Tax=Gracilibacillus saliphilus TaxID=543890 RepID=UPI0013D01BD9|nr:hypothetical protein [Gracilibacillus saliphilus]